MNVYPIGNNLIVKWTLRYSDGTVFPLSLYDYDLSYRTSRGVKVATDTTVEDNVLRWMLKADDQVVSGPYSLALKISFAGNKAVDLQYNNAFALTSLSHGNGANVEVCIESNCDMIDLKDAVLQARKAMDVALTAKDIAGSAVNTADGAEATANEAKTIASTANNTSIEAKTIANNAKTGAEKAATDAEKAATDASRDAAAAQQAAQTASDHITSLQQAIAELPDGQAVSEKVAEHTIKLTELGQLGQQVIYDVTANNGGTTFASLSALLSNENLSNLIPIDARCGGMSIRFVRTSDNKYVQYRLMSDTFNTNVANWQGVDEVPTAESDNLVKSSGVKKELMQIETDLYKEKEIYKTTNIINAESYPVGTHVGEGYSVCEIPKDITITRVTLKAPTGTSPKLDFAKLENGILHVLRRFTLNAPVDKDTMVETDINYTCTDNGIYAIISGGFVYEVLSTTINLPYIVSEQYNPETGQYISQEVGTKDLNYAITIYGINKTRKIEIEGSIQGGNISPEGIVVTDTPSRCLYYINCEAAKTITVSNGDAYGFFADIPKPLSEEINRTRYIENLSNTILYIPETARYLAVRAETSPVFKVQYVISQLIEKAVKGTEEKWMKFNSSDISMFEKIGFCGDSYMAGMIVVSENPTVTAENPNLAWGKILERTHGIQASLFARGSTSTIDVTPNSPNFLTEPRCLPALLAAEPQNLYVISLGHNDCYISAYPEQYGKTWTQDEFIAEFKTNYNSIINAIQNHAPNAKIIICQQSRPYALLGWGAEINVAIKEIAEEFGIPCLNPEEDEYLSSDIYQRTMVHRHPTFAGYAGMAKAFDRLFSKATVYYWEYFKGYTGL